VILWCSIYFLLAAAAAAAVGAVGEEGHLLH
jgi:hypothetical protein